MSDALEPPTASARPLVVRCGAFGDMVLLTALIRELHARFLCPIDIVTSGPWSEPLLQGQAGVGEILCLRSRKTPYWLAPDQQRVVRRLRARAPGPIWLCDADEAVRGLLRRAGIGGEWIVDVREHPLRPGEHATEQWRRFGRILPAACEGRMPPGRPTALEGCELRVPAAQAAELDSFLRSRAVPEGRVLAVQMGNKRTMRRGPKRLAANHKYWPAQRWAAVIRRLREDRPRDPILLLGTGPEFSLNEEVASLASIGGLYNLADDLPVPRLVALLARAAALITVDSGPAHVAAAVGCPQVVLFGKALPSLYRPWGTAGAQAIVLTGEVDGAPSMLGIRVEDVVAAWTRLVPRETPAEAGL